MSLLVGIDENKKQQIAATQADTTPTVDKVVQQDTATQTATPAVKTATQSTTPTTTATTTATTTPTTATATTSGSGSRSAVYEKAMQTLKQAQGNAPTYSSSYDDDINEIYNQIVNRAPFKYDYSTDPLYNQYKEQYTQLGKQAMKDTMGQTAALTGGYGNSYGSAVGQQQYDAYLQRLNDVVPELYGQAYDIYSQEANDLEKQYSMLLDRQNTEYNEWRDALSDYRYDQALELDKGQQLASDLAAYGDFSGYAELYGKDAAAKMEKAWAAANPLPAYINGQIDAEEYYRIVGEYPIGYTPPGSSSGSSGGGWTFDPWYGGTARDTSADKSTTKTETKSSAVITPTTINKYERYYYK